MDAIQAMCHLLELTPGLRVLEIGTGSGYTSALLGHIVGERGSVVSLDVDPTLTERARIKHAEAALRNVTVHTSDGYAGWPAGAPYDRPIGWATPHLLPRCWVEQTADRAVIVTPVSVLAMARAHLVLRVDVNHGKPIPRDVHAGSFIEMHPDVITDVAVPIRYCDALHRFGGSSLVWVSAPHLRAEPARAQQAAQMIASGHPVPSPLRGDSLARNAFYGYLYACRPHGLASAGSGGAGPASAAGAGLILGSSAALLRPQDMYVAGTGEAEASLHALLRAWERAGRPDHSALQPMVIPEPEGFRVQVRSARKPPTSRTPQDTPQNRVLGTERG